jgi:hypothetical protein
MGGDLGCGTNSSNNQPHISWTTQMAGDIYHGNNDPTTITNKKSKNISTSFRSTFSFSFYFVVTIPYYFIGMISNNDRYEERGC